MKISGSDVNIAFFVSDHGFGHAARAAAVMGQLRKLAPQCGLEVFSGVPEWFFAANGSPPVRFHDIKTDVGMVQKDPFRADIPATLTALERFLPFPRPLIRRLAAGLSARGCRAVVCDISPLGIAVADALGVPSILVENFTWDWIYEQFVGEIPAFGAHIKTLSQWYSRATVHLQTEPVCRSAQGATRLHPISRPPLKAPAEIRSDLGVSDHRPLVLLTTGGVPTRHRFMEKLQAVSSAVFVVPHDVPKPVRNGNVISLPTASDFHHPDLVAAADLVVGKLGYSTLAEVGHAGTPFGYILREENNESEVLTSFAGRFVQGQPFSEADFSSGRWMASLDPLLKMNPSAPAFPNDAARAAEAVWEAATGGNLFSRRLPPAAFDPFNDRRSRDIRNQLSEAFVSSLLKGDPEIVRKEAGMMMAAAQSSTETVYREYVRDRISRYWRVLDQGRPLSGDPPVSKVLCIWNAGLFFESHEYLEVFWQAAAGAERKALQGLIHAAGTFVQRTLGREVPAKRLSARAVDLITSTRAQLSFIQNLEELVAALKNPGAAAPQLKGNGVS